MAGPLLSRENLCHGLPNETRKPQLKIEEEFEALNNALRDSGREKLLESCFRFLSFCLKNQRALSSKLTSSLLKSHCSRLYKHYRTDRAALQNDPKFVQCFMWFGQFQSSIFRDVYIKGIGDKLAVTYVMLARALVAQGDIVGASEVLLKGTEKEALPSSYLEEATKEINLNSKSTALQPKERESVSTNSSITAVGGISDPYSRFYADPRDFSNDICRMYDFRGVYPVCNHEEFQFEEVRVQHWKTASHERILQKEIRANKKTIEDLQATILRLREELATYAKSSVGNLANNKSTENLPASCVNDKAASVISELFDGSVGVSRSHNVIVTSSGRNQSVERTDAHDTLLEQPNRGSDSEKGPSGTLVPLEHPSSEEPTGHDSTIATTNRTETMTRAMRDLLWNGTLVSAEMASGGDVTEAISTCPDSAGGVRSGYVDSEAVCSEASKAGRPRIAVFEENSLPQMASTANEPPRGLKPVILFDENAGGVKRKCGPGIGLVKRMAVSPAGVKEREPLAEECHALLKGKGFDNDHFLLGDKVDEDDKENIPPDDYQRPSLQPRRINGILVDADGFDTVPGPGSHVESSDDESADEKTYASSFSERSARVSTNCLTELELGVEPLEPLDDEESNLDRPAKAPTGRSTSTPTGNKPHTLEMTWRVTEVLRGERILPSMFRASTAPSPPAAVTGTNSNVRFPVAENAPYTLSKKIQMLELQDPADRRLSTILEASKESGSSGSSSNSSSSSGTSQSSTGIVSSCDESQIDPLNPVVSEPFSLAHRNKVLQGYNKKLSYEVVDTKLPVFKKNLRLRCPGGYVATILKVVGEGAFAKVYAAKRTQSVEADLMSAIEGGDNQRSDEFTTCLVRVDQAALKVTHDITAGMWEYYILCSIRSRLNQECTNLLPKRVCIRKSIPEPHYAEYYRDGFLISLPYLSYGSLVDLVNAYRAESKQLPEMIVRYLVVELMIIVRQLHEVGVLHADIKPDNVLFRKVPTSAMLEQLSLKTQCLSLIDFGQAIDLKSYPPGTTFSQALVGGSNNSITQSNKVQRSVSMRTPHRQWLFDFDWFGVANCAHTLLFGEYISIQRLPSGSYGIKRRIPRYWASEWWENVFSDLINMDSTRSKPQHPDNPVPILIESGERSLSDRSAVGHALELHLAQLSTLMHNKRS